MQKLLLLVTLVGLSLALHKSPLNQFSQVSQQNSNWTYDKIDFESLTRFYDNDTQEMNVQTEILYNEEAENGVPVTYSVSYYDYYDDAGQTYLSTYLSLYGYDGSWMTESDGSQGIWLGIGFDSDEMADTNVVVCYLLYYGEDLPDVGEVQQKTAVEDDGTAQETTAEGQQTTTETQGEAQDTTSSSASTGQETTSSSASTGQDTTSSSASTGQDTTSSSASTGQDTTSSSASTADSGAQTTQDESQQQTTDTQSTASSSTSSTQDSTQDTTAQQTTNDQTTTTQTDTTANVQTRSIPNVATLKSTQKLAEYGSAFYQKGKSLIQTHIKAMQTETEIYSTVPGQFVCLNGYSEGYDPTVYPDPTADLYNIETIQAELSADPNQLSALTVKFDKSFNATEGTENADIYFGSYPIIWAYGPVDQYMQEYHDEMRGSTKLNVGAGAEALLTSVLVVAAMLTANLL